MTVTHTGRSAWRWGFLIGIFVGAVLACGGVFLWLRATDGFRYHYVAARDMALFKSPGVPIAVVPRGSEVFTMLPLEFDGDDYGSDAWIRVGIQITDAKKSGLSTFKEANLKEQGVPHLWLKGLEKSE